MNHTRKKKAMNWTEEKIKEVYEAAMRAAMTDEEFRKELLADPKVVIEKLTGAVLPEGFKLKVLEEDPECDMTILLPPLLDDELSEEDMDQVAGGKVASQAQIKRFRKAAGKSEDDSMK